MDVVTLELLHSRDVARGEVHDVDVVPDAGAVAGVVVLAKDGEGGHLPGCDLAEERHDVRYRSHGVFA